MTMCVCGCVCVCVWVRGEMVKQLSNWIAGYEHTLFFNQLGKLMIMLETMAAWQQTDRWGNRELTLNHDLLLLRQLLDGGSSEVTAHVVKTLEKTAACGLMSFLF